MISNQKISFEIPGVQAFLHIYNENGEGIIKHYPLGLMSAPPARGDFIGIKINNIHYWTEVRQVRWSFDDTPGGTRHKTVDIIAAEPDTPDYKAVTKKWQRLANILENIYEDKLTTEEEDRLLEIKESLEAVGVNLSAYGESEDENDY